MTAWLLPPVSGRARLCDAAAVAKPEQAHIRNSEPGGVHLIFLGWELVLQHCTCRIAGMGGDTNKNLHDHGKPVIFPTMHFSHHISQLHSTFSLLAALLLRVAR